MSPSVRGLASGVDINRIIDELMEIERKPVLRHEAQISRTEILAGLWRDLTVRFDALQRSLQPLLSQGTFNTPVATSSDPERVGAAATGKAATGSYDLKVEQIAVRHCVASGPAGGVEMVGDPSVALGLHGTFILGRGRPPEAARHLFQESDWLQGSLATGYTAVLDGEAASEYAPLVEELQFAEGFENGDEIRLYLEGFTGGDGKEALDRLAEFYDQKGLPFDLDSPYCIIRRDDIAGTWQALNRDGDPFYLAGDHPRGDLALRAEIVDANGNPLSSHCFSLKVAETFASAGWVTIGTGDNLYQIAGRINDVSGVTGVTATVVKRVEGDWRLVLESRAEGMAGQIQGQQFIPAGSGSERYGEDDILASLGITAPGEPGEFAYTLQEALDAHFTLNGLPVERASNSVADLIEGLTLTLREPGEVRVEVQPDRTVPQEAIERFVNAYNEANSLVRAMLEEETGPLQGDPTLLRLERRLRSLVHGPVLSGGETSFRSLAELGIASEKEDTAGYIYIDAIRLERVLEEDPEAVSSFFGSTAGTGGLARQLDRFTATITGRDGVIPGRRAYLDRQIERMRKQVEVWEERLARREANLVRRFTFMEQYISRMQEQTGLLATFEMQWQKQQ